MAKTQLNEMLSLINRMDNPQTGWQTLVNENIEEVNLDGRTEESPDRFFDLIGGLRGGKKITFGYLSVAKLNFPQIQRENPATGRMKKFTDWETVARDLNEENTNIAGILCFSRYKINWRTPSNMTKHYNAHFVDAVNPVRVKYGISPINRRGGYKDTADFGKGIKVYNGTNDALQGNTYSDQDMGGKDVKKLEPFFYYIVFTDGSLKQISDPSVLSKYIVVKDPSGVPELRKALTALGKSEDEILQTIEGYKTDIKGATSFRYRTFTHNCFVYIIATVDGEKKYYFNPNLEREVEGVVVNGKEIEEKARELYQADIQNNSNDLGDTEDEYPDEELPNAGE